MAEKNNVVKIGTDPEKVEETVTEQGSPFVYTHEFSNPFTYEGKTFDTITFDWGSLTGKDNLAIEAEMRDLGISLIAAELSSDYLIRMAARACTTNISFDAFAAMPLRDFNNIRSSARRFLLGLGL